ncbi:hypothetical protein FOMPIDRAFT_57544 [Fomitopsis schrenkii]|uniref:DUF4139 domain-containing protein n=1 Tax=Fomitopsis schrenkii TaxID=2126942 RepID=S8FPF7_FOMSC|nr:hypothetical protein FOMPIDRAFT_57544 [Fomitopsis schrenkii]
MHQPGRNIVKVTQLSSGIDTQSFQVSHLSGNASVLDIQCDVDAFDASLLPDDNSEMRRSLLLRKRELEDERRVQDQGLSLFVDYARTLNSAHTAPGDAVNFLDAFMAGRRSTVATIRKLDDEIAEIDKKLKGPVSDPSVKGDVNGRATIVIVVSEPCTAEVDIAYDVKDASWEPYYNLHATTANGQPAPMVSLQYNARVTHTSGEDWADISFNFVAADAPRRGHNAGIPSVAPRKLHRLPTPFASVFPTPSLFGQNAGAAPPSNVAGGIVVRESTSTRDVRLAAETKASVASDGLGHAIPITSLALDASFTWVCVPRSRAAAFVECHTKNSSVHTLVAGPLTVYVDGQGSRRPHCRYAFPPEHWSVHTDPVQDIKPNAAFFAPLGVDDAVRIVLRRAARTEEAPERPFVERLWTTACTARYAVTNGHAFAIPQLVLRDALPVSANPQIAVVVNAVREKDPRAADGNSAEVVGVLGENVREREGREGEGLFEWVRGVEAGQTVVLHAEWEIHTPSGVSWEEEPVMKP